MNAVFLSLGGNIGDRHGYMQKSRLLLEKHCGKIVLSSPIYETEAWGSNSEKKYLNQVVKLETKLTARQLLKKTLEIEKELGRKRRGSRNSDRSADIDILFFNNEIINAKNLHIPHPRLHLRKFVLVPLNSVASSFVHPNLKKTVTQLLKTSNDKLQVNLYKPNARPLYICIEGNIGSGKTTLAKKLAAHLDAKFLPEQFEDNHLLPLFYEDKNRYAFPLEYSFLIARFEQLKRELHTARGHIVSDFSIYKCLWFAKANLSKKEYKLFEKHFSAFVSQLPVPSLVVYIDTSVDNLKQNIKKRGRLFELGIAASYLKKITFTYREGLSKLDLARQLTIPVKKYHPKLENESIKAIENYLKENFGWQA